MRTCWPVSDGGDVGFFGAQSEYCFFNIISSSPIWFVFFKKKTSEGGANLKSPETPEHFSSPGSSERLATGVFSFHLHMNKGQRFDQSDNFIWMAGCGMTRLA